MKTTTWIIIILILIIGIIYLIPYRFQKASVVNQSSDTTITINNYYDTTIYSTRNNTTIKPTQTLAAPLPINSRDSSIAAKLCDSIRTYDIPSSNDSMDILSHIRTQGILLNSSVNYKWKKAILTEKTIQIKNTVSSVSRGILINFKTTFVTLKNPLCVSGEIGFINKKNWIYTVGYNSDKQYIIGVGKMIKKF